MSGMRDEKGSNGAMGEAVEVEVRLDWRCLTA